ncbi:MAG: hypothetical protein IJK35_10105 [Oscillospiraceae bacterium]|nr:hypothetical protein [Oscillospiraceae bacterium]
MNEYASLSKKRSFRSTLVVILVLLIVVELCSLSVLFSQLSSFSAVPHRNIISLTEGSPDGTVEIHRRGARGEGLSAGRIWYAPAQLGAPQTGSEAEPQNDPKTGFGVYDEDTVWSTHTDVEIFRVSYDSEVGYPTVSVNSEKGDKVFAPGTEETYSFTLSNDGPYNLDYILTIEAFYENTDGLWIPIEGRLSDGSGAWLVGSSDEWPDVLELDGFRKEGKLPSGTLEDYRIDWRWPFERFDGEGLDSNDAYDTMLGNLAVDEDLILHIIIRTEAWIDEEPEPTPTPTPTETPEPTETPTPTDTPTPTETPTPTPTPTSPAPPRTGDEEIENLRIWGTVAGLALVAIVVVLIVLLVGSRKKKDDESDKA